MKKLEKKLKKLEKAYDLAHGPIAKARILKSANSVIKRLDKLKAEREVLR